MNSTIFDPMEFGPDIAPAPIEEPASAAPVTGKRTGRPKKYRTEAERKEARNARDRRRRERTGTPGTTDKVPKAKETPVDAFAAELAALKEGYAESPKVVPAQGIDGDTNEAPNTPNTPAPYVTGYMLLLITDTLFPPLVGFIFRRDASGLTLTAEERKKLEPVADAAAADVLGTLTPAQAFFGTAFALYASKIRSLPPKAPKERKPAKAAK